MIRPMSGDWSAARVRELQAELTAVRRSVRRVQDDALRLDVLRSPYHRGLDGTDPGTEPARLPSAPKSLTYLK